MQNRIVIRLNPVVWVQTPLGDADAEFMIEVGDEHHLQFVCWIHETGECWTFQSHEIRRATNVTMGRDRISPFSKQTLVRYEKMQSKKGEENATQYRQS
jgi:hypothetical protein